MKIKSEDKKITYKGTHQDFSKKSEDKKEKSATKVYRAAIISLFLIFCMAGAAFYPSVAHADTLGPVSATWYFAEGRVGAGFLQWLTISNMSGNACAIKVQEYYTADGSGVNKTNNLSFTVNAQTRFTDSVNNDLNTPQNAPVGITLSAIVSVDTMVTPSCPGVVVERPVYFANHLGVSSGTDIIGATTLNTTFDFADVPTGSAGESFLALFDPQSTPSTVTATYYNPTTGAIITSDTVTVAPFSRSTIQPGNHTLPSHVSVSVASSQKILVERPAYFSNGTQGSADVIGVSSSNSNWYFAEGHTGSGTQENIIIANFGTVSTSVTITLKSTIGATHTFLPINLLPNAQAIFDVNVNNTFAGSTPDVAADVIGANIVVQRQMYTSYSGSTGWMSQGVTDAFGATSPHNSYSYAEGFTSVNFNEYLELQNPGSTDITVTVNLVNMLSHAYSQNLVIPAMSRVTVNITNLVANNLAHTGEDSKAYAVSMSVLSSGTFVSERTMYWNAFGTQGSSAMVGYSGN